jgi:hypothetical protein
MDYKLLHFVNFSIPNQSQIRIALRLRLRPNDATPCGSGSGSATLAGTLRTTSIMTVANVGRLVTLDMAESGTNL